ncbi:cytochrome c biogenesis protein ResB [Spiribacter insolitus]|uniref:Cytochrome c biogenesis protein ResB n=1 Tax=Spiribacter insolitus TaxID=3122417 RepID=A0ABV3T8K2_9GAMM
MAQSAATISTGQARKRGNYRRSLGAIWLEFLGSMNLAITLLVVVSIASIIGTVLPQNNPYSEYLIQFGPFWFEVFRLLNLYDVYSAWWFLAILGFLVLSTGVCVSRHIPGVWREITRYRTHVREKSLLALSQHRRWQTARDAESVEAVAETALKGFGFRTRRETRGDTVVVAGMKGGATRMGYVLTHVAVVVIALGALADGNINLKIQEMMGSLAVETRDLPVSQVPAESWLGPESGSFRGNVTIPEETNSGVVFLQVRDGYVVQQLPFEIYLEDFRIDHYPNGMPSSYESDLVIHDPALEEPIRQTISVNHPLTHRGHTIYQASFTDGGTALDLTGHLLDGSGQTMPITGRVFENLRLQLGGMQRTMEIDDFQLFNVDRDPRAVERTGSRDEFRNVGPSFNYTMRDEAGQAREFHTYMAPVQIDDRWYYLHGMRSGAAEPFRYLHIPADGNASMDTFMNFHAALHDRARVDQAARRAADVLLAQMGVANPELGNRVAGTADDMIATLVNGGFGAVNAQLEQRVAGSNRPEMLLEFSRAVLQRTMFEIYREELAARQGVALSMVQPDADQRAFFEEAMNAVSAVAEYGSPIIFEIDHFDHRQATGLQITRAPGKNVVYAGSALLVMGIFMLFYVSHRRVWAMVMPREEGGTDLLMAGTNQRRPEEFEAEFADLADAVENQLGVAGDMPGRRRKDASDSAGPTEQTD